MPARAPLQHQANVCWGVLTNSKRIQARNYYGEEKGNYGKEGRDNCHILMDTNYDTAQDMSDVTSTDGVSLSR
jgi:hypothetical protein